MNLKQLSEDTELVERLAAGDLGIEGSDELGTESKQALFDLLYGATLMPITKYFEKLGISTNDSHDLFHEFMFHLVRILKDLKYKYDPEVKFSTWLFRVAKHFALNYKRRWPEGKIVFSFDEVDEWVKRSNTSDKFIAFLGRYIPPNFSISSAINPLLEKEKEAEMREQDKAEEQHEQNILQLHLAMSLMSNNYRIFILLRYGKGLTYDEIVASQQILSKRGKPASKGTLFNIKKRALYELSYAYVIIVAMVNSL